MSSTSRFAAKNEAINRPFHSSQIPRDAQGQPLKTSQYFAENIFNVQLSRSIPETAKKELADVLATGKTLSKELAEILASAVTEWAVSKGATHFCHWFQPLTGVPAEKHDSFLGLDKDRPIEKLSASQLMQGEPDASSFPHGGSRSTFEARGYTSWDITSPMFIIEGPNGKTLCIPTAFISYNGDALDIKTPLLRSCSRINEIATKFLNLIGNTKEKVTHVDVTAGTEQEYFLVDKVFYYLRPDLVMTGKTLFGSLTAKNQQLEDHYFGTIRNRVLSFMQDLEIELYKLGVPAKTRHNEVAPGQYELAPIYRNANIASDQNQLVMATLERLALKHDFKVLLHEKPFSGINGSGKHVNWSLADNLGRNLFNPGETLHDNYRFLAFVSMVMEAINRHADIIRAGIAGHGNDHRLGANEAPPSIISIYLGETLSQIFESLESGGGVIPSKKTVLDVGANQLARLFKDNTDRNRTSPFAFTGDKFEFRAVGAPAAVGFPISILNAAFAEVMDESCGIIQKEMASGKTADEALITLAKKWYRNASQVVFNGDGYSEEWVKEANRRGLPNFRNTPDSLSCFKDSARVEFLNKMGVFRPEEIKTRYNVLLHRYITHRHIECETFKQMVAQYVIPTIIKYKESVAHAIKHQKDIGMESRMEKAVYQELNNISDELYGNYTQFLAKYEEVKKLEEETHAKKIATELLPLMEKMAVSCNVVEERMPDELWPLPKYYDMLFVH